MRGGNSCGRESFLRGGLLPKERKNQGKKKNVGEQIKIEKSKSEISAVAESANQRNKKKINSHSPGTDRVNRRGQRGVMWRLEHPIRGPHTLTTFHSKRPSVVNHDLMWGSGATKGVSKVFIVIVNLGVR